MLKVFITVDKDDQELRLSYDSDGAVPLLYTRLLRALGSNKTIKLEVVSMETLDE